MCIRDRLKGRTHGCTDQCCKREESPCQLGAVHTWHLADNPAAPAFVRYWAAGSTGRCNTGVKSLRRGFELQGLSWPFVELTGHFVQMGLRVHRQVGSLGKILSQQTVGVLIGSELSRALWITEVDVDIGRQRKSSMIRKFLAPVPGQRLIRDSPDDSRIGADIRGFPAFRQDRSEFRTATVTSDGPNGGRGADLAIFAGIWTHSSHRQLSHLDCRAAA